MARTGDVDTRAAVLHDLPPVSSGTAPVAKTVTRVGVALVVALGLFLRIWILGRDPTDELRGIVGMTAIDIQHGHFFTFFWGQNYGGVEPYVVAAMFTLFGRSSFTLGLTPVFLCAVAAVLLWRIGRRLFSPVVGAAAGLLFWIWPEIYVYASTNEQGFRYVTMVCGLAVWLLTLRISDLEELHADAGESISIRIGERSDLVAGLEWGSLGLFAGIGWWSSPEIVYYVLPAAWFLGWRLLRRRIPIRPGFLVLCAAGVIVGALPWIWTNAKSHLASFRGNPPQPHPSYATHLSNFFGHSLPMILGLRPRTAPTQQTSGWFVFGSHPLSTTVIGVIVYVSVLAGLVAWMVELVRRRQALLLVGAALLVPFLYAMSPFAWNWVEGRYGLLAAPIYTLLVASAACAAAARVGRPRLGAPLVVLAGLALTVSSLVQVPPYTELAGNASRSSILTWQADPNPGVVSLVKSLEAAQIKYVWSSYYLSWELNFGSGGRIVSSDVRDARYVPLYLQLAAADSAAWLFVEPSNEQALSNVINILPEHINPGCLETDFSISTPTLCVNPGTFEAFLSGQGIGYRIVNLGLMMAVEPSRPVPPEVLNALTKYVPTNTAFNS
jgi:4-amino-4-deoxy-L-arabinose transferase-like glycosyltransferase